MDEPRLFADVLQGFVVNAVQYFGRLRHLAACEIPSLTEEDDPEEALLVVVGNEMPYRTKRGAPVPPMLDAHLAAGGSLLLLGPRFGRIDLRADFHAEGQMGSTAGLFWWKVWKAGQWVDYDPRAEEVTEAPTQQGAVYWGEGPLFRAWEHRHGLFGFEGSFRGVYDVGGDVIDAEQPVAIVYTDWAMRKPWTFHPLAFTVREDPVVTGPHPERYPCAALLWNEETGARIILVAPALCSRADLLHRVLGLVVEPVAALAAV